MDVAAAHVGFIFAAYALSAAVLGGLAIRTLIALKALERKLEALEARQAPRRKAQT
jgi:heme exporter protein CcmD